MWGRADEGDLLNVRELCRKRVPVFHRSAALNNQLGYIFCRPLKGVDNVH